MNSPMNGSEVTVRIDCAAGSVSRVNACPIILMVSRNTNTISMMEAISRGIPACLPVRGPVSAALLLAIKKYWITLPKRTSRKDRKILSSQGRGIVKQLLSFAGRRAAFG